MRFIEKTDCKLSVNNDSLTALSGFKIESIFLFTLDFAADFQLQLKLYTIGQGGWQLTSDES